MSLISRARDLAYNPEHTQWLIPTLLVVDAALCGVIIDKVACKHFPCFQIANVFINHFFRY